MYKETKNCGYCLYYKQEKNCCVCSHPKATKNEKSYRYYIMSCDEVNKFEPKNKLKINV